MTHREAFSGAMRHHDSLGLQSAFSQRRKDAKGRKERLPDRGTGCEADASHLNLRLVFEGHLSLIISVSYGRDWKMGDASWGLF